MIDKDSDWISFDAAVAYMEAVQQCYREKARDLVQRAADNLELRSRTVPSSGWAVSNFAGVDRYHSDGGKTAEVWRKDVLKLWPEHQKDAMLPAPPKIGSNSAQKRNKPISDGIRLAINNLWPGGVPVALRAKEREKKILEWLKREGKSIPADISRATQRVLKAERGAQ